MSVASFSSEIETILIAFSLSSSDKSSVTGGSSVDPVWSSSFPLVLLFFFLLGFKSLSDLSVGFLDLSFISSDSEGGESKLSRQRQKKKKGRKDEQENKKKANVRNGKECA